jgi:predicted GH43/DUF377 family glycosyl hydrolase
MTDRKERKAVAERQELARVHDLKLRPDATRTVLRPFLPGDVTGYAKDGTLRRSIVASVMGLASNDVEIELARALGPLRTKHRDPEALLLGQCDDVFASLENRPQVDRNQRLLIGSYFSEEYSFQSAALFNPSIVRHPDQAGAAGDLRFVLSLRGIGEGHLSSLTFRTGIWHADGSLTIDDASRFAVGPRIERETMANGRMVARLDFDGARDISESVIYPFLTSQGLGIEDMRLVEFTDRDGAQSYRGTYTAFSDTGVRQGLIETRDFRQFVMRGVEGELYAGKGMALFPRQIGGRYAMLSRPDNRRIFLVTSDDLYQWSGGTPLIEPRFPWEWTQIGNCGSPIEIDEGFLVITHGVGPVRTYSIGAVLLDKHDPSRILGRLRHPLLSPEEERDGYVPNIVYSCGALLRGRDLLLPYALADDFTRFATVSIDALVASMIIDE